MNTLRDQAERQVEAYRNASEWTVSRQVVLSCVSALWAQQFTPARIAALSEPLLGQPISEEDAQRELTKMVRGKLLRRNMSNYEVAL